jgi:acylglycerol lipase
MGAGVLLLAATSADPPPVAGYVLLAPGVRGRATMSEFARATLEVASRTIPAVGFSGSAPGFAPTDNEEAMRRWSRDPLTTKTYRVDLLYGLVNLMDDALAAASRFAADALILYGGHDLIVPARAIRQMLQALPPAAPHRLGFYAEGHHLLLRDQVRTTVAADIAAWIAEHDAPLPSRADAAADRWMNVAAP